MRGKGKGREKRREWGRYEVRKSGDKRGKNVPDTNSALTIFQSERYGK